MIGASASLLIARTRLAPEQPATCWVAPLTPAATYRSGAIFVPVWPTCSVWGRQPEMVTAREQPTAAPSRPARSTIGAKPAADPTPRPPVTTTLASASETPPVAAGTRPT